ncbi:MAG TPA: glycosyltransferase family 2 protein [Verrucomicrobiae bacterium]|nr:glycosyltransferase family 2 protein [Verrucomicrobiae bacterium]
MESYELCAVIPCFNEVGSIGAVVRAVLQFVAVIWVVDDGSADGTGAEAERAGATVIRLERNLGKGAALREGLKAARGAGFKFAVTLDGDGQHDAGDVAELLKAARGGADLVIGNRMGSSGVMPWVRCFVNRWMSGRLARRLGVECPDSQCGFRVIRLDAWEKLELRQNRFEVESEMLAAFARAGMKIAFVPVKCLPAKRASRIRPIVDSVRWFRWFVNLK